jgi:hypothetical protein
MQYILDTSSLRSLDSATLRSAQSRGHCLLVSPITVWELLSHLADTDFQLARGNVRKVQMCRILHDPLGELMADIGCTAAVNPSRFEDNVGLQQVVSEVATAESYAELQERRIVLNNQQRVFTDLAPRILSLFDSEQAQFASAMRARCHSLIDRYGRTRAMHLDGEDFYREATGLARILYEDALAAGCSVGLDELVLRSVYGAGYSVARACQYIGSNGEIQHVDFDRNDLEDYFISLHLNAASNRILVTDDNGVSRGIRRTVDSCSQFLNLRETEGHGLCPVITSVQFRDEMASSPSTAA